MSKKVNLNSEVNKKLIQTMIDFFNTYKTGNISQDDLCKIIDNYIENANKDKVIPMLSLLFYINPELTIEKYLDFIVSNDEYKKSILYAQCVYNICGDKHNNYFRYIVNSRILESLDKTIEELKDFFDKEDKVSEKYFMKLVSVGIILKVNYKNTNVYEVFNKINVPYNDFFDKVVDKAIELYKIR